MFFFIAEVITWYQTFILYLLEDIIIACKVVEVQKNVVYRL